MIRTFGAIDVVPSVTRSLMCVLMLLRLVGPGDAVDSAMVQLFFGDTHLSVPVQAFDREPQRIVTRQLQRHAELLFDDHVTRVLDPHGRAQSPGIKV